MSASKLIATLRAQGVDAFIVCAGSRNLPLVEATLQAQGATIFNHFEEREAAFFGLGLAKQSNKPVCVVTTSGTAVSETLPAVIEAYYTNVPLVVLSADRPSRYRGTGAPQAIEQRDLLLPYARYRYDGSASNSEIIISRDSPSHINICFEETFANSEDHDGDHASNLIARTSGTEAVDRLTHFLADKNRPLILFGEIPYELRRAVIGFSRALNATIYAEAVSGLRECREIAPMLIKGGERLIERGKFDCIVRIGSVPTLRFWRDIETRALPTLSIDSRPFSGSPASALCCVDLAKFFDAVSSTKLPRFERDEILCAADERAQQMLHRLLYRYPQSEPAYFYSLSHVAHEHDSIFLGNSLPIREWELAASRSHEHRIIRANRGANGIDGQISTFLGTLDPTRHNWAVVGDLTALYGTSGLWIADQISGVSASLIVVNNRGGKIFERVAALREPMKNANVARVLVNSHHRSFEHVAKLWGIEYMHATEISAALRSPGLRLVEVTPDEVQTNAFWLEWDSYWANQ